LTFDDRTFRVTLSGDLDVYRTADIASMLRSASSADRVVIDCTGARFADSTFVLALMRFRREFVEAGGDPLNIVIIASGAVRRILEISGLLKIMTVLSENRGEDRSLI
jgi:anti-anti-sigma factor